MLNPDINDIKLVDQNYIDDFCNKNGFYKLYNNKLEHTFEPIKLCSSLLLYKQNSKIESALYLLLSR